MNFKLENIEYLIIYPDIHGRYFWKDIFLTYKDKPNYGFIFLGDYVDPYYNIDGISEEESYNNFIDLLNTCIDHPRTKFLIGNHDYHYLIHMKNTYRPIRRAITYYNEIANLILKYYNKLQFAYQHNIKDKLYIFTHAGITIPYAEILIFRLYMYYKENMIDNPYIMNNQPLITDDFGNFVPDISKTYIKAYNADLLNSLKDNLTYTDLLIWMRGYERGGYATYGSFIWADLVEHIDMTHMYNSHEEYFSHIYQIFAHTYCKKEYITDHFAMLDCKHPFILNTKTGELKKC